jgi:hypothetical protein
MKLIVVLLVACACAAVQARSLQQATMNDPRLTTFNRALKVRLHSRADARFYMARSFSSSALLWISVGSAAV